MKSITVQDLQKLMNNNKQITLVDVRERSERVMASIDGSVHVPMMSIPHQLDLFNKDEPIDLVLSILLTELKTDNDKYPTPEL